jgi:amidase
MSDLWRLSATALAAMVRGREVSAHEVATDALARLDAVNPWLNAVVEHRPDDVLAQADAIDRRIAAGEDVGPLAGVPATIKSATDQAGYVTSNGLTLLRDQIAPEDNPVVSNLRRAGCVLLGRTNTPAFSLRWFTNNLLHGRTRNPRDPALTPGGSSGGAASAVASGIGALAQGSDIGGSIRYPAYACGIHGLRPSLGRVPSWNSTSPTRGIGPQLMAVNGPLARTMDDIEAALLAMSAPDPRDPWYVPIQYEGRPVSRRVALCLRPNGLEVVPEVIAALQDAARRLEAAGYAVEEVADTPSFREGNEIQVKLWLGDNFQAFVDAVEREGDPGALRTLEGVRPAAAGLPPDIVPRMLARRAVLVREFQLFLDRYPLLLTPVCGRLPFPDDADMESLAAFRAVALSQITQTGLPALSLPALAVATGLVGRTPVGVQLIASRYREDLLIAAGKAIEAGGVPPSPVDPAM